MPGWKSSKNNNEAHGDFDALAKVCLCAYASGKIWEIFCPGSNPMLNEKPNAALPGEDLVEQGLSDLAQDRMTECALLVLVAAPRLRQLGIPVPEPSLSQPCEHELYTRLDARLGPAAHSHYNSLIRRIVSYARSLEREQSPR